MSKKGKENTAAAVLGVPQEIKIGEKTVELKPFVIQVYIDGFSDLVGIWEFLQTKAPNLDLDKLDKISPADLASLTPILPKIVGVLERALKLEDGYLTQNCSLFTLSALIVKIFQVNGVSAILANFGLARGMLGGVGESLIGKVTPSKSEEA